VGSTNFWLQLQFMHFRGPKKPREAKPCLILSWVGDKAIYLTASFVLGTHFKSSKSLSTSKCNLARSIVVNKRWECLHRIFKHKCSLWT
jgi:hypothetical protein